MFPDIRLDPNSAIPLYRQLYVAMREALNSGTLRHGERLPATRELAGLLGLNRTTVSAAYELLESEGLIRGHVGRGSFVLAAETAPGPLDWERFLGSYEPAAPPAAPPGAISFATARPSEKLFPFEDFRASCEEVLSSGEASAILQLGSPYGYAPLREYLLGEARREGVARATDDVLVTSGCQQALDLVARVLVRPGVPVLIEDPVYPGLRNLFQRSGAQVVGVPVGVVDGFRAHARLLVTTPTFQNPTGLTLPLEARNVLLRSARGLIVIENDIYGELRYAGQPLPALKQLDDSGDTVLLRSFSKLTFPGLRVGWIIGPRPLIARLAEAKQLADLHSDQLSQAVLLRFAQSGRLAAHRERVLAAGAERLRVVLEACARRLPPGSEFTRPEGGMSLWVRLPHPLDASDLLARAHRRGAAYLPGRFFEVSRRDPGALRLSFAGLEPDEIRTGLEILGEIFTSELARARSIPSTPAPALV